MIKENERNIQTKHEINPIQYENLEIKLIKKYVDDVLTTLYKMKLGTEWDPSSRVIIWSAEKEIEHKKQSKTEEEITMIAFSQMASAQINCLQFTHDEPGAHPNKRMPFLDT